jgi:molybdopterin biosynthesis enzyme
MGRLSGHSVTVRRSVGELTAAVRSAGVRTAFVLAVAEPDDTGPAGWRLRPLRGLSSADMFGPHQANCYVEISPGEAEITAGRTVSFEWLASRQAPGRIVD